jgi:hypothetical protein
MSEPRLGAARVPPQTAHSLYAAMRLVTCVWSHVCGWPVSGGGVWSIVVVVDIPGAQAMLRWCSEVQVRRILW